MKIKPTKENFDDFDVYTFEDKYCFYHINIHSKDFYNELFHYLFDHKKLLKYAENRSHVSFDPNLVNYSTLYAMLENFLDAENIERDISDLSTEIQEILKKRIYSLIQ